MKVGLLVIASEVLEGKITDLNTKFLADFLREFSLDFHCSETVRDLEADIHRGLGNLLKVCDVIITSGGLGPTKDDLTKLALASHFGAKILYSEEAHNIAHENYKRFQREYPGKDHGYSYLPEGFIALPNSTGMAPGLFINKNGKFIFSGPGVPREFKSMLTDHFKPWIEKNILKSSFSENVTVRTKRVPEEKIFGEVDHSLWEKLEVYGDVSSLPIVMGVDIGVKIKAASAQELNEKRKAVLDIFSASPVKSSIWHIGREKLEEVIVQLANSKGYTFSFAESCTGGLCSHRVTGVSGSGQSFHGSVICYDPSVKINILNVKSETIDKYNVVSEEVAHEMCIGVSSALETQFSISITGLAGPSGGTPEIPVGTVCYGVHSPLGTKTFKYKLFGDREQLKERFAQNALLHLHEAMEEFASR